MDDYKKVNSYFAGILVSGTVGEGILMAVEERLVIAKAFVAAVKGRVAIYVHTGQPFIFNFTDLNFQNRPFLINYF